MAAKKKSALDRPVHPDQALSAVVGRGPMTRGQLVKKLWGYIKRHRLQNEIDRRRIDADSKLALVLGKRSATMFEMTKLVERHIG